MERCDIVIVGGGIAGSALATVLARDGLSVVVLEATANFPDRVRGESMQPWGVAEARTLGLEQVFLDAGAHVAHEWLHFDADLPNDVSFANPLPVGAIGPEVTGSMNLRHPDACAALATAAAGAGARVVRGVTAVDVLAGSEPEVAAETPEGTLRFAPRLVVGADGRNSAVRRQVGIELDRQRAAHMIAGLLVGDLPADVPTDRDVLASQDDLFMASFFQPEGRLRVYLCPPLSERHRFSGPGGTTRFLDAAAFPCIPWGDALAHATPAGPLAAYPGDESWCEQPYAEGVVLIGDAAGHNNPIIGQGLSISLRDVRMVRDVVRAGDVSPAAFTPYGAERMERLRRLRAGADFMAATFAEDCDDRPRRRARFFELQMTEPLMFGLLGGLFGGPENGPAEAFDGRLTDAIRSPAAATT
jgi:2-polyprenyl-6-methoxyphenol hydroxylase-like FAD-dependent oxidoreductase